MPVSRDISDIAAPDNGRVLSAPGATRRTLTWVVLALCAVANIAVSAIGGLVVLQAGLGAVTLACIVVLVVSYVRKCR